MSSNLDTKTTLHEPFSIQVIHFEMTSFCFVFMLLMFDVICQLIRVITCPTLVTSRYDATHTRALKINQC